MGQEARAGPSVPPSTGSRCPHRGPRCRRASPSQAPRKTLRAPRETPISVGFSCRQRPVCCCHPRGRGRSGCRAGRAHPQEAAAAGFGTCFLGGSCSSPSLGGEQGCGGAMPQRRHPARRLPLARPQSWLLLRRNLLVTARKQQCLSEGKGCKTNRNPPRPPGKARKAIAGCEEAPDVVVFFFLPVPRANGERGTLQTRCP